MYEFKTVDIKGKQYVTVNERIKYFRENYPEGRIITEIIEDKDGRCVMKASIYNGDALLATGHAYEKEESSFITKTSYLEVCETSAVGRALGVLGIGIDTSIATAEEVANAMNQGGKPDVEMPQEKAETKQEGFRTITPEEGKKLMETAEINKWTKEDVKSYGSTLGYDKLRDLNESDYEDMMEHFGKDKNEYLKSIQEGWDES